MPRVARSASPELRGRPGGSLKVLVTQDGHLKFAAGERPAVSQVPSAPAIAVDLLSASEQAVIDANRAKLAELKSQPYAAIPDFPEALVAGVTRALPGLSYTMTVLALKDAGLLPEDAMIAGASALAFIANWLADRGYGPSTTDPVEPPPSLFYERPVGIVTWLLLDWIHRSMAAGEADDSRLEEELDGYYSRWSRTDFEWDITRLGQGPVLNPTLPSVFRPSDSNEVTPKHVSPISPHRHMHTLISPKPAFAGTAVHSLDHSVHLDKRDQRNRARGHRAQR
jgi:hypothetical protein